jgi:CRP/FNR family transcriptional regulator, cyclic AMP receptor protein
MPDLSRAETTRMLASIPLFKGLTKRQLSVVAKAVDHQTFEPDAVLVREQAEVHRLIIIRSGTAAVMRRGVVAVDGGGVQQGDIRRLGTVGPGDVVGELSLIDGKLATASVVAETPLDAVLLYRTRFTKLLTSMPELYPRLLVAMAGRIRAIDQRTDVVA